jgi:hypothetical protein
VRGGIFGLWGNFWFCVYLPLGYDFGEVFVFRVWGFIVLLGVCVGMVLGLVVGSW